MEGDKEAGKTSAEGGERTKKKYKNDKKKGLVSTEYKGAAFAWISAFYHLWLLKVAGISDS